MAAKKATGKGTSKTFAKGGTTPMFGKGDRTKTAPGDAAGAQKPGTTAHAPAGSGGMFPGGGGGKMFGFAASQPAKAGITSAR